jgi:hypothetical protein
VAPPVVGPTPEATQEPDSDDARSERRERKRKASEAEPAAAARKERPKRDKVVDCTEPFVIDAQGIRRPKRECL